MHALTRTTTQMSTDERREWLRIDDRLLLEYRLLTDTEDAPALGMLPATSQAIADAIQKPAADFFAQHGEALVHSPLLPWMMKVDWLLEVIVKTLAQMHPGGIPIAQLIDVNLSASGISFLSPRQFAVGDKLSLKMVLPPFTPINTTAQVVRSVPAKDGPGHDIGTEFTGLALNDQEHLIRHILQTQAERLRASRNK
jgi:PilZ domain